MARKLRLQYPGAIYHVMSRGDRREPVFLEPADYELFLATLGETCAKTDWQIHAYCLMPNHFHLVVETPKGVSENCREPTVAQASRVRVQAASRRSI
jgi:REP element-mobilizing transposase RayT